MTLFDPTTLYASTTPLVTSIANYLGLPILVIGFSITVVVTALTVLYIWFIKRGVRGAARALRK